MDTIEELDLCYQNIISRLNEFTPDGVREVDLHVLQELGLLGNDFEAHPNSSLTKQFLVIEAADKITLYNESFIAWVVPTECDEVGSTLVLLAINKAPQPHLEVAFAASGVYNSSKIILRVMEKYLADIQETEEVITAFQSKNEP